MIEKCPATHITKAPAGKQSEGEKDQIRGNSLFPVGSKLARLLVVPTQPVHTGLDQDEPELGIAVLPVPLQVLAHGHSLLDKAVEILGDVRGNT